MSERDLYLIFLPQIVELIIDCQQMTQEGYENWKQETRKSISNETVDLMEKVFIVTDKYSGHQQSA